jgi:hypothetical protein
MESISKGTPAILCRLLLNLELGARYLSLELLTNSKYHLGAMYLSLELLTNSKNHLEPDFTPKSMKKLIS